MTEEEMPAKVRPYAMLGLNLNLRAVGDVECDCPFCGRQGKFRIRREDGRWRCYVCSEGTEKGGGNVYTFMRLLLDASRKATGQDELASLAADRGLHDPATLTTWGACRLTTTDEWAVPGTAPDGKLNQLYRWVGVNGKRRMIALPDMPHQMHGIELFDPKKVDVYVCEGPWDAMTLWEALGATKRLGPKLVATASLLASMMGHSNVVAVPGCGTFSERWTTVMAGKRVHLMYDNDHPRTHPKTGKPVEGGSLSGTRRVAQLLAAAEEKPLEVLWLRWGKDGHDPDLPSGHDVRDFLSNPDRSVQESLAGLLTRMAPIPKEWVAGRSPESVKRGAVDLECKSCDSWNKLINSWRKAMKWTEGLDRALSVMLATAVSTPMRGDQLWCKIMGPAACGKSTLCEALSVCKRHVKAKSTLRGFHSGYRESSSPDEDNSLVSELYDKTLVTKDGDTLLQSPNLSQILSEARDVYDRVSRTSYRTKASKDYSGVNMTWLLCGTSSLRAIDSSELGERFLDCVIVDDIDLDMEDEVGWRVANRAAREVGFTAGGKDGHDDPDMTEAKQLTGGYVSWLRDNVQSLMARVESSPESLRTCQQLATFTAYMRARPSAKQEEKVEREMSFRLISQLVRLGKCLAAVMNKPTMDEEVMRRVRRVAMDTARGRTLKVAGHLVKAGRRGMDSRALELVSGETQDKLNTLLRFMRSVGIVDRFVKDPSIGYAGRARWRLTPRLEKLCAEVGHGG